jgi:hypothetical protein
MNVMNVFSAKTKKIKRVAIAIKPLIMTMHLEIYFYQVQYLPRAWGGGLENNFLNSSLT